MSARQEVDARGRPGRRILSGIRVLDITHIVAGPACTRILADLGADVIKLDAPAGAEAGRGPRRSAGPVGQNVGKRSVVVDLKTPAGVALARELAGTVDVLVQNYRPGALAAAGLGYEALRDANPRLIYLTISGFGQDSSYRERGAFGATAHAEAGWLWVQQMAQGGDRPFAPGVTVADVATGMNAAMAILAALYDRERTGVGQEVDIALMDSQLSMLAEAAAPALAGGAGEPWTPFRHGLQATKDGHLAVNIGSPANARRIAAAMGRPDVPLPAGRAEAERAVEDWAAGLTTAEAVAALESAGAPYGVVKTVHEAVEHPYFAERGMIAEVPDVLSGAARIVASPLFFSAASSQPAGPAPLAGQHSREVLRELGRSDAEIDKLVDTGVVEEASFPGDAER